MDLNSEKTGSIKPQELKFFLNHWGMQITEVNFNYLFSQFDADGDGIISYKDFVHTVGCEIHPSEGLYFRQDKPEFSHINSCAESCCWQPVGSNSSYCEVHIKIHQDKAIQLYSKMYQQCTRWNEFLAALKKAAEADDEAQIFASAFLKTVKDFGIKISHSEFDNLLKSFPGRNEGDIKRINIARLYDQKYIILNSKMYEKVNVFVSDGTNEPVDAAGYTGQFLREKRKLKPLSTYEILNMITNNKDRLSKVWLIIRHIDKQRNGYVTNTELDDILKEVYPELMNYDLSPLY